MNILWMLGLKHMIRYRRGKLESNDVDIVISHADLRSGGDQIKGLSKKLVQRLYDRGTIRVHDLGNLTLIFHSAQASLPMSRVSIMFHS